DVEMPGKESRLRERYGTCLRPRDAVGRLPHDDARILRVASLLTRIDGPHPPIAVSAPRDRRRYHEPASVVGDLLRLRPGGAVRASREIDSVGAMLRLLMTVVRFDHFAIVQAQLVRGGIVRQFRIGKISATGLRDRVRYTTRYGPVIAAPTAKDRRVLDARVAVRIGSEREPEALAMPRRWKCYGARVYDLLGALVRLEGDWDRSAESGDERLETLRRIHSDVAVRLDDAVGTATDVEAGAKER